MPTKDVTLGLYRYLGRTRSRLLALPLTIRSANTGPKNQPGTTDEYPNWRVPLAGRTAGRCCWRRSSPTAEPRH